MENTWVGACVNDQGFLAKGNQLLKAKRVPLIRQEAAEKMLDAQLSEEKSLALPTPSTFLLFISFPSNKSPNNTKEKHFTSVFQAPPDRLCAYV